MAASVDSRRTRAISPMRTAGMALFLLTSLNLFNFIDRYVLPGVQPLIQHDFRINDAQAGTLTSAFFLTYMLIAPLTGWLGDRFARKPLIIAGALIWSAATLLTATVHSYETLLIRHAVVGVGEATFSIFAPALLADFYPEEDRNRVLSIFYVSIPVGGALGYVLGGMLGERFGWRMPFYVAAAPGVLIALGFWLWVREPRRGAADTLQATAERASFWGLFRNAAYLTATLGMAMWTFSVGGISTWLPTFFHRFAGYSVAGAGLAAGEITAVDGLLATVAGGWLAQVWLKRNHRALHLASAWSALLAIPFGVVVFFGPGRLLIPAAYAAEFWIFFSTGPLNTAIVNSVSAPIRATAISVNLFLIHLLGDFPSPHLIGWISDRHTLRVGLGATLVSLAVSGMILLAGARFAPRLPDLEKSQ
jgi:MFS transporter, Spinster family, sphingosine-1-phosphate transporter